MGEKMDGFLRSIGIQQTEDFDLEFLFAVMNPHIQGQIDMAIVKSTPWSYTQLSAFLNGLANIRYPYSLRFNYDVEITPDDVSSLFIEWYFDHYYVPPTFELVSPREGVIEFIFDSEEERKDRMDAIGEFSKLLGFFTYPYAIISSVRTSKEENVTPEVEPQVEAEPEKVEPKKAEVEESNEMSFGFIASKPSQNQNAVEEVAAEEQAELAAEKIEKPVDPLDEGRLAVKRDLEAAVAEGEEVLLDAAARNYKIMMEERARKRVWTTGDYKPLHSIAEVYTMGMQNIDFDGELYECEIRPGKNKGLRGKLSVGDWNGGVNVRAFENRRLSADTLNSLKPGQHIRVRGAIDVDKFTKQRVVIAHYIDMLPDYPLRDDEEEEKRVELHLHTKMSTMDAVTDIKNYCNLAAHMGMKAIAVTDHGVVQAFPAAEDAARKLKKDKNYDLKILYGCELYTFNTKLTFAYNPDQRPLKGNTYVIFDTETTGLSSRHDRLIEFGAVKMVDGKIVDRFDTFINPEIPLSEEAMAINHITNDDVKGAPTIKEALPSILQFLGDHILVAHNASFDIGFLNTALEENGHPPLSNPVIDTVPISRFLFPTVAYHNEGSLLKNLGLSVYDEESAHRADYDANALAEGFREIVIRLEKLKPGIRVCDLNDLCVPIPDENDPDPIHAQQVKDDYYSFCRHLFEYHTTVLVKNQQGLKDLYRIISKGHDEYLFRVPTCPLWLLEKYRENFLIGSACFSGEIFEIAQTKRKDDLVKAMAFYDYIEIQPPENYSYLINMGRVKDQDKLIEILKDIIEAAEIAGKPVVATGDVHYLNPEDKILRDVYIMAKGIGNGAHPYWPPKRDKMPLFDNPDQHFRSTKEMLDCFRTFLSEEKVREIVIKNTNDIADQIEFIEPVSDTLYTPDANLPNSDQKIRQLCEKNFEKIYGGNTEPVTQRCIKEIWERLQKELSGIIDNGYAVTYYIAHQLIKKANNEPEHFIVGSRGSVGSSFAANLAEITEVNPLPPHYYCPKCHHFEWGDSSMYKSGFDLPEKMCPNCGHKLVSNGQNIPFETFLGFDADKVPDIDLNFEEESQHRAHNYTKELLGEGNVFRAGTIETVADKTAYGYVRGYFEKIGRNPDDIPQAYVAYLAYKCTGVKRTTGQHPGGIVVIPADHSVYDFTAIQHPANDLNSEWLTTHFDFRSMHDEVLKLDILGHVDPMAMRYYRDLTGVKIEDIPMNDPRVLSLFTSPAELKLHRNYLNLQTGAVALPEFGTDQGMRMLLQAHPTKFNDLLIISGLAHGTDVWSGNAETLIAEGVTDLNGVIGCRDDIMTFLISKGVEKKHAFKIMEGVRKGKGLTQEQESEMRACKVPDFYIESCKKIKYLFPRGHATAYVMMAVRVAYFKLYYPLEFYSVFFSIRSDDWAIEAMIKGEEAVIAKINEFRARQQDRDNPLSTKESNQLDSLLVALEMLERGYKFSNIDLYRSDAKMFVVDHENKALIPPFSVISGLGVAAGQSIVDARKELGDRKFLSKEDLLRRATKLNGTNLNDLDKLGVLDGLGDTNQMSLFDFGLM